MTCPPPRSQGRTAPPTVWAMMLLLHQLLISHLTIPSHIPRLHSTTISNNLLRHESLIMSSSSLWSATARLSPVSSSRLMASGLPVLVSIAFSFFFSYRTCILHTHRTFFFCSCQVKQKEQQNTSTPTSGNIERGYSARDVFSKESNDISRVTYNWIKWSIIPPRAREPYGRNIFQTTRILIHGHVDVLH